MQTFKDSVTGKIYQSEEILALPNTPHTIEPYEIPEPTQTELDDLATKAKWTTYVEYCSTLTVTADSGNKFAADQESLKNVAFKRDAITDTVEILWVESWATFTTGKVELQEVISEAANKMQLKIVELFGA